MYGVYPEAEALNHSSQALNVLSLLFMFLCETFYRSLNSSLQIWKYFDVKCYSGVKQC